MDGVGFETLKGYLQVQFSGCWLTIIIAWFSHKILRPYCEERDNWRLVLFKVLVYVDENF